MPQARLCSARCLALSSFAARCLRAGSVLALAAAAMVYGPAALDAQTAHFSPITVLGSGFSDPIGVAVDASNNVYVADTANNAIKKIPYSSGNYGTPVTLGSGFNTPYGVAVDATGNVYVADSYNNAVKKIPYSSGIYGTPVTLGSGFNTPYGVAVDASGNVYVGDYGNNAVKKIPYSSGSYGTPVTLGSGFTNPWGVAVDASGNIYVADYGNSLVKKIPYNSGSYGTPVTLGSGFNQPTGVAVDASGNVYVADFQNSAVKQIPYSSGNYGTPVTLVGGFNYPKGVAVDASGNVYVAEPLNNVVVKSTFAGNFGPVAVTTATPSTQALTFAIDSSGTLPTLTSANVLTQGASGLDFTLGTGSTCTGAVTAGNTCTVSVAFTPQFPGQRLGAVNLTNSSGTVIATALITGTGTGPLATVSPGLISALAGNGTAGYVAGQDGGPAVNAELNRPNSVVTDGAGNLYIADEQNHRIRKVTVATGVISTVAGTGTPGYVAAQDGGLATSAQLYAPDGVAVDGAGNLYIADTSNHRIRKVAANSNVITTVAGTGTAGYMTAQDGGPATSAQLNYPEGVAVDAVGNLYIADSGNARIRKVTAATGKITTVAGNGTAGYVVGQDGGAATSAELNDPYDVVVDGAGNLYIADFANNRIREVTAAGIITTLAGNGTGGYVSSQDGGAATAAEINHATGVAIDAGGDLYIADLGNHRIRKVAAATGIITTVAGNGTTTYASSQNGGTAVAGAVNSPAGVSLDGAGNLYIAEYGDSLIREVSTSASISFPTATTAGTTDSTDGTRTATLNNIGNTALTLASMANTNSNFVLGNPNTGGCSTAVAVVAGGSCILGETFTPASGSSGLVAGALTVNDNSLNVSGSLQYVPLSGTTTAGAVAVSTNSNTVAAGTASVTFAVIVSYSGAAADIGAVTLTVSGSATGVSAPVCTGKGAHKNCTFTYTGTALATGGSYPVVVSVAADATDGYAAASASANLYVTTTHLVQAPRPQTGAMVVPAPVVARPGVLMAPAGEVVFSPDASSDAVSTDSSPDEGVKADPKK